MATTTTASDFDFDSLSLGELFAEADKIGRKYQTLEEVEDIMACIDGANEALSDIIADILED